MIPVLPVDDLTTFPIPNPQSQAFHTLGPARPDSRRHVRLTSQQDVYFRSTVTNFSGQTLLITTVLAASPFLIFAHLFHASFIAARLLHATFMPETHPVELQGSGGWVRSVEVCDACDLWTPTIQMLKIVAYHINVLSMGKARPAERPFSLKVSRTRGWCWDHPSPQQIHAASLIRSHTICIRGAVPM